MITYGHFITGLRYYIEEITGVTTVWRYPGYKAPPKPFLALEMTNTTFDEPTKMSELVEQTIYLNLAHYATDVISHAKMTGVINDILLHHTIPLMDSEGEIVGSFNVSRINSELNIPDGTWAEDETNTIRTYTDFSVELSHVRIFK